ncbi:YsnF/AvaK domain-containing protein, partial [Kitasatospora sp. NPDC056783]|uniref:YsnF/AvaK domain-containing protein n=1 Tax=Kitasatospora sp. NPDC056783 TaxID=3345943 RepID=UPI003697B8C0
MTDAGGAVPEADPRTLGAPAPAAASPAPAPTAPVVEPKHRSQPAPAPAPAAATAAPRTAAIPSTPAGSPVEITRREERLDVTTEWHTIGTAKLRKYVTTEQVERRVPLVHERVRVERMPVGEAERAGLTEKEVAEAVEEVTLREERPVIRKYLAPVERVRLVVERYTFDFFVMEVFRRFMVFIYV